MTRDLTVGATHRRLHELGYAATSATHPDRMTNQFRAGERDSLLRLAAHPAAVMTYPRLSNGASVEDGHEREVISLILTAYLLSDARQSKAVLSVLTDYGLLSGPCRIDSFGNHLHPLKWSGIAIFDNEYSARLCCDDDDATVFVEHAIVPERFETRTDQYGAPQRTAVGAIGSHIILLDGEWKGGHLLDTPRADLPELLQADLPALISEIERVRWTGRPAARDAAA